VITWSTPGVLWFADGDLSRGRRLVDYLPARPTTEVNPTPTTAAAAVVSPVPSGAPGLSPSPTGSPAPPPIPAPVFEAAAISYDRRILPFLVSNPPDKPGAISLRVISPQDPPGAAPQELGSWPWVPASGVRSEVSMLPDGHILFTLAHHFDSPEADPVLVGVAEAGSTAKVDQTDPQGKFLQTDRSAWPGTKNYLPPPALPRLENRVAALNGRVAGGVTNFLKTPLVDRTMHEIVEGRAGSADTSVVCAAGEGLETVAFAPDGHTVAIAGGGNTDLLDLDGGHALASLLRGRVLAWRA
jgi:hypothetical protein